MTPPCWEDREQGDQHTREEGLHVLQEEPLLRPKGRLELPVDVGATLGSLCPALRGSRF